MDVLKISTHAEQRMQQRGIRWRNVDLVRFWGTQIDDNTVLLRKKDMEHAIRQGEREIDRLWRLCGTKVVLRNGVLVTCYRATDRQIKGMHRRLRHGPHRCRSGRNRRWPSATRSSGMSSRAG
jgi:hypothetical protein